MILYIILKFLRPHVPCQSYKLIHLIVALTDILILNRSLPVTKELDGERTL